MRACADSSLRPRFAAAAALARPRGRIRCKVLIVPASSFLKVAWPQLRRCINLRCRRSARGTETCPLSAFAYNFCVAVWERFSRRPCVAVALVRWDTEFVLPRSVTSRRTFAEMVGRKSVAHSNFSESSADEAYQAARRVVLAATLRRPISSECWRSSLRTYYPPVRMGLISKALRRAAVRKVRKWVPEHRSDGLEKWRGL
jgi:hypothetical protein